jgi:hypothetical protein
MGGKRHDIFEIWRLSILTEGHTLASAFHSFSYILYTSLDPHGPSLWHHVGR